MKNKDNLVLLPSTKEEFSMDTFVDPITLESITVGEGDYMAEDIFNYSLKSSSTQTKDGANFNFNNDLNLKGGKNQDKQSSGLSENNYCVRYCMDSLVNYLLVTGCFQEPTTKTEFSHEDIENICCILRKKKEKYIEAKEKLSITSQIENIHAKSTDQIGEKNSEQKFEMIADALLKLYSKCCLLFRTQHYLQLNQKFIFHICLKNLTMYLINLLKSILRLTIQLTQ